LLDKFATGLSLEIDYANPNGSNNSNWSVGFGPFARYYFFKSENRVNIFSEANLSYSTGLSDINNERTSLGYGLSAGSVLFF
jgi:hypothetical protein